MTLWWLVEPSREETLGCVRLAVSKCLANLAGEGIPRGQGNVHAQLSQDPYLNTVSPVHVAISRRMVTNGLDFLAGGYLGPMLYHTISAKCGLVINILVAHV
jgi:hypothetical protein